MSWSVGDNKLCDLESRVAQIRQRAVLQHVLLHTLVAHPEGLTPTQAYDMIEPLHEFPPEWYREMPKGEGYTVLEERGISDWRKVPQEKLVELVKTEPQWQNELRWARNELRKKGYLDTTVSRVWRLTPDGIAAGSDQLEELAPAERAIATPRRRAQRKPLAVREGEAATGVREVLFRKLRLLSESMPIEDLDLLVDLARAVRMRSLSERS
jgi:hypothetical protein